MSNAEVFFEVGQRVRDLTACKNGWTDKEGEVIEVDGSNILVRYPRGVERWKLAWNLERKGPRGPR